MKSNLLIAILVLVTVGLSGCVQSGTGTLVMQITDAPADLNIEKALVTISNVEVHLAGANEDANATYETGWFTVVKEEKTFDLIKIKNVKELIGCSDLKAGKYTQIRLNVDKALVTIDGTEYALTIPSKTIKLVKPFDIVENQTTKLTLDFDAKESIKSAGKDKYVMNPTIKVILGEPIVAPPTPPPQTPTSISMSKTLAPGELWELGNGWAVSANSIDAEASPRQVWLVLVRWGVNNNYSIDDAVVNEGNIYTYAGLPGAIYVEKIFIDANTNKAQLRYSSEISTPTTIPKATVTKKITPAPSPSPTRRDPCRDCLSSCRGMPGCCEGCGCMCESECGGCIQR
ncbi:MAG: DUF4382 domain-containing protein [Candidatus Methanoperedens sp.]|nr:DUF4382 domain-containing protein [Candidatus Methanoperedens sp.]MCZ7403992.1 DUF4382 domain-containing protein [Candidatus Methanoperedens sp.]